jgi:hypothetical protein
MDRGVRKAAYRNREVDDFPRTPASISIGCHH